MNFQHEKLLGDLWPVIRCHKISCIGEGQSETQGSAFYEDSRLRRRRSTTNGRNLALYKIEESL